MAKRDFFCEVKYIILQIESNGRDTKIICWRTGTLGRLFPAIFQNDAAPDRALTSF